MQNWIDDRRNWYLPLVGGAEMNRVKPGAIYYLTSLPYPIVERDTYRVDTRANKIGFGPSAGPKDEFKSRITLTSFSMSVKLGDKDYNVGRDDCSITGIRMSKFSMSVKITNRPIDVPPDEYRAKVSIKEIRRFSALQFYVHPEVDTYKVGITMKGFSIK